MTNMGIGARRAAVLVIACSMVWVILGCIDPVYDGHKYTKAVTLNSSQGALTFGTEGTAQVGRTKILVVQNLQTREIPVSRNGAPLDTLRLICLERSGTWIDLAVGEDSTGKLFIASNSDPDSLTAQFTGH